MTTKAVTSRIACTGRDRETDAPTASARSAVDPPTPRSEFAVIASEVGFDDLLAIMDRHMDALRVVCPAEYNVVMSKLMSMAPNR